MSRFPLHSLLALALVPLLLSGAVPAGAISTRNVFTVTGLAGGDWLGTSVASAGDFNGDGFEDALVGVRSGGQFNQGEVLVLFGGPDADGSIDLVLTGESGSDYFGEAVASAGDFDGDGYDDVIVGAYSVGAFAGRAYLFLGGPDVDSVADLAFSGSSGQRLGSAVGSAGDINGDGFDDLIVGAPGDPFDDLDQSFAYVHFGGVAADTTADLVIAGNPLGDETGTAVGPAGDVNGDGFADFIVGVPPVFTPVPFLGHANVYFGGFTPDATADLNLVGVSTGDDFGSSAGGAGDINGDGFDDLFVGASLDDNEGLNAGRVYVYFGGANVDEIEDLVLSGEDAGDIFGHSVDSAGDVNGDGFDDLVVGARSNSYSAPAAGRAYVYFGSASPDTAPDLFFAGEGDFDQFGRAVAGAGDLDGDGLDEILVGTPLFGGGSNNGRAYLYSAFPYRVLSPTAGAQWVAGETVTVRWEGHDVADIQLSTDGTHTWTIFARGVGGERENSITLPVPAVESDNVYLRLRYEGQTATLENSAMSKRFRIVLPVDPPSAAQRLTFAGDGEVAGDAYGRFVASAGDVNGDGYDDIVVGADGNDSGGADAGRAYVIYRGPGQDDVADLVLTGLAAGDGFGVEVRSAGDFNADGYDDVIAGAPGDDSAGADAGAAYVFLGGPGADAIADFVFTSASTGGGLGISVAPAGDVNGDGYDDVVAGANDFFGGGPGQAFVYFGGPGADPAADLVLTGQANGDRFGFSVDGAGDVNGDGFDDIVVGAERNDAAGTDAGRIYVYLGGPTPDGFADLIVSGESSGDRFGYSVRGGGDVNGDGLADVLAGAWLHDGSGNNAGRAYVFHGSVIPDATPDLVLDGEAAGDVFGRSLAGGADVNRDGFADVVVGAPQNDANGADAGRAYVFFGGPGTDALPDAVFTGETAGDGFGRSVGLTGSRGGDGFADVLVGAPDHDGAGGDAGRVYLYESNRYHLLSPGGGALWNVGATEAVRWLGSEPADLWLSVDGGISYELLSAGVGGRELNVASLLVPHAPTRFARLKVAPTDAALPGEVELDSLFTVEASIAVLAFGVEPQGSGTVVSWQTDPGPEELSGYRLERAFGSGWNTIVPHTRETSYEDPDGSAGSHYRLTGINGLGDEYVIGETTLGTVAALAAGPLPYRGGDLRISFGTLGGLAGARGAAELSLYDVNGRRVRTISRGDFPAGTQSAVWDGRDQTGRFVSAGIYFLRVETPGNSRTLKLAVIR